MTACCRGRPEYGIFFQLPAAAQQTRAGGAVNAVPTVWVQVPASSLYPTLYQYPGQPSPGPIYPPPVPELPDEEGPANPPPPPRPPTGGAGGYPQRPPGGIPEYPPQQPQPQPQPQPWPQPQPQPQPQPTPAPEPTTPDPVQQELLKSCKSERGQFPDPKDCSKFINCWDGTAAEQECNAGLLFNPEKSYCDYPENVDCGSRPNPLPPQPPSQQPPTQSPGYPTLPPSPYPPQPTPGPGQTGCKTPFDRYRSPTKCGTFYVCDNGNPIEFQCPPGLDYSEASIHLTHCEKYS
ncbi:Peritrophin-1 [Frankliniella fusca]|uniref:Peritrophin-1 n=1 Tax=Frankliniella fusca TaxID=407009 RepID=A0AAE1HVF3_9NEOP|nr:Peritrophin-1 [Frankliniella fusca]